MKRAAGAALLGAAMALAALLFDTASLWVPSVALLGLAGTAAIWVTLAARGAGIERAPGPPTIEEEQPYPLRLELRPGMLPPPGGELREPLLDAPIPLGGRTARKLRIDVRFARRGKRVLQPGALTIADPLGLAVREISGGGEAMELLVLPRVEPLLAAGPASGGRCGRRARLGWRASRAARASGRLRRRARPRRPAPVPRGHSGLADPLARRGPHRGDAGAAAHRGRGLGPAGGARRHLAAVGRGARHGGASGGVAVRAPGPPRAARCCCRATAVPLRLLRTCRPGRLCTRAWRW